MKLTTRKQFEAALRVQRYVAGDEKALSPEHADSIDLCRSLVPSVLGKLVDDGITVEDLRTIAGSVGKGRTTDRAIKSLANRLRGLASLLDLPGFSPLQIEQWGASQTVETKLAEKLAEFAKPQKADKVRKADDNVGG